MQRRTGQASLPVAHGAWNDPKSGRHVRLLLACSAPVSGEQRHQVSVFVIHAIRHGAGRTGKQTNVVVTGPDSHGIPTSMEHLTVGAWLIALMSKHRLSVAGVAAHFEIHPNTVSAWRTGQNDVSRHHINGLCDWLGLDDDERLRALRLPVRVEQTVAMAA